MGEREKSVTRLNSGYMKKYDAHVERQRRKRKRLIRRLVLFAAIVVIAFGSMATYHLKQRELHATKTQEYQQLEEELASLKQKETYLNEEIELLKDDEYILDIARTNYFFSKEGELIFKIPNQDPSY
ncbi:septum formation initiator family protein [Virgibacillus sp. MSJ-26]|uniref:FtsB family cell division protein n=1 Tax=Virgibacillus sp. MSJ-26 TaxID=2841522 RepID=UPI001C10CF61|nr:septum formation initiator family protein [Virgibacillus sp. MSJ-26]MBU5467394.1 septum formation initiator family protein [Virgibacillus sp. MSJ-26]